MQLVNSYTKQVIGSVDIPTGTTDVLAFLRGQGHALDRATVGSAKSIGITEKVVWVFPTKPAQAKTPKAQTPAKAQTPKRYTLDELTPAEKRAITTLAKALGVRRDVAARQAGLLG